MCEKKWAKDRLKMLFTKCLEIIYLIYMYKKDLALNNRQWLICHKTKVNQTKVSETAVAIWIEAEK